ncbi:hypothetical protein ACVWZV_004532 [Bradyrhizobium sp. GM5.1]
MSIAARRDENEHLKALLAQTQAVLSEHQAALATSEEARRRLEVILGELRREKFGATSEKAAARSVSLAAGRRGDRARHPGRGAGESRGCDQGPIAERAGSRFSSQPRLPACPFAAGGTDHRACEYALPVRLRRHDEDRRGRQPAPRRDPGAMARADHTPPKIHLSPLLRPRRAGARTGARRARRAADRSGHRACDRLQIWRPYAILPSGRDLCAPGHPA